MTLIYVAANWQYVVQISDRRLTTVTADGKVATFSDVECKAIHVKLPDADLLIGYTGLARVGAKPMDELLMEAVAETAAAAEFRPGEIMGALRDKLTALFKSPAVRVYTAAQRRLSVMVTGFLYSTVEGVPHHTIGHARLTNYQDWGVGDSIDAWDEFTLVLERVRVGEKWPTLLQRIGDYHAVPLTKGEELRPLLAEGKPAHAVRDKFLSWLPELSASHPSIGSEANCAILRPLGDVVWTHAVSKPEWTMSLGSTVIANPELTVCLKDASVTKQQPSAPMLVPQVPRQKPCPCKSGLRYRQCHGRKL